MRSPRQAGGRAAPPPGENYPTSETSRILLAHASATTTLDPRLKGHIARGRTGGRLLGSGDAAVKKFFPGDDEDVEPDPRSRHSESVLPRKSQWVTLPTAPSIMDASLNRKPESYRSPSPPRQSPPREFDRREEVDEATQITTFRSPQRSHPDRQSESHDITTPAPVITESVVPPVQVKEELYKIVSQVGEGTFGKVYKAQNIVSSSFVALKRIRMEGERDGFPVTAMREIKLLQSLRHPNVVNLHEMMVSKGERDGLDNNL